MRAYGIVAPSLGIVAQHGRHGDGNRMLGKFFRSQRYKMLKRAVKINNRLVDLRAKPAVVATGFAPFDEIAKRAGKRSDVNEHLATLFVETLAARPKLIVELGVRGGESTFAFERAAALTGAKLVSVDIEDCTNASRYPGWMFVKSDDVAFAAQFPAWCRARGIEPRVDVLFIDSSHLFEHTVQEIDSWFPHLSPRAKVFFHDTNLKQLYFRKDGSWAIGWDNQRGVIAAIERFFGARFDETVEFVDFRKGWIIRHDPWCAGLTILDRVLNGQPAAASA